MNGQDFAEKDSFFMSLKGSKVQLLVVAAAAVGVVVVEDNIVQSICLNIIPNHEKTINFITNKF